MAQVPPAAAPVPVADHENPEELAATEAVPVTGTVFQHFALQEPETPFVVTLVAAHRKSVHISCTDDGATDAHDPPNAPTVVVDGDDSGVVGGLN